MSVLLVCIIDFYLYGNNFNNRTLLRECSLEVVHAIMELDSSILNKDILINITEMLQSASQQPNELSARSYDLCVSITMISLQQRQDVCISGQAKEDCTRAAISHLTRSKKINQRFYFDTSTRQATPPDSVKVQVSMVSWLVSMGSVFEKTCVMSPRQFPSNSNI